MRLSLAGDADQSFHVVQIFFERAAAGGGEAIFGFRHAAVEGFGATEIAGVLELARVNAEVAVGGAEQLLEFVESERFVDGKGADDRETRAFMNQAIEIGAEVSGGRAAGEFFLARSSLSACSRRYADDLPAIFPRNYAPKNYV
jgi:hypothetical protein